MSPADNIANSLDPDQARLNVGPDLDTNCLTPWWDSRMIFFFKIDFEKYQLIYTAQNI